MSPEDRKRAEYFARLASLPTLDGIPVSEAIRLQEDLVQLGYRWLKTVPTIREHLRKMNPFLSENDLTEEKVKAFRQWLPWIVLHDLHQDSKMISDLLDTGKTELDPIKQGTILTLDRESRTITEEGKDPNPQTEMLVDLVRIIRFKNFPFLRCPTCSTIFVPVKNQRFCTAKCSQTAKAETQPEKKKDYMRDYMKRWREKKNKSTKKRRKS